MSMTSENFPSYKKIKLKIIFCLLFKELRNAEETFERSKNNEISGNWLGNLSQAKKERLTKDFWFKKGFLNSLVLKFSRNEGRVTFFPSYLSYLKFTNMSYYI